MTPVGMNPSLGALTTSYKRGPMAANAFQSQDFQFFNTTPAERTSAGTYTQDQLNDYASIRAAGGSEGSTNKNPVVRFFSNMIVGNMLKS